MLIYPALPLSHSNSASDLEKDSDDEFFDVEMEAEWSVGGGVVSSPSMSAPVVEEDPSDIEEDEDYDEQDDTSGMPAMLVMSGSVHLPLSPSPSFLSPFPPPSLLPSPISPDGIQANKSVIMHMLSQVRVGMDLTRIVLPTFILEKRSLLEMYAEFLAHPDLFAA